MRGIGEFVFIGAQNAGMIGWYRRRFFVYRCSLAIIGCAAAAAVLAALLFCAPSYAVSPKDKMGTCKFGADDQHLQGKARSAFMKKCMSNQDEPRGAAGTPPARH
jgi:psiF repeat